MKKILLIIAAFVIFLVTVLIYEKTSFDESTQILYGVDTNDSVFKYDLSEVK